MADKKPKIDPSKVLKTQPKFIKESFSMVERSIKPGTKKPKK